MPPQSKRLQQQRAKSGICRYNAPRIRIGRIALSGRSNCLIVFADLGADIVQMAVDAIRFETAAFGAAAADLPKHLRNGELRAELGDATVDRDATHDRDDFLIFVFVPFKVEQNLERAAHKLCFLGLQK